ncbi:MAG: glutamyl-tRNA reductase [Gammaproteobacteria bacterium]
MLVSLGINHNSAPVDIRERVAFGPDVIGSALSGLLDIPAVDEAAILSTCNRTELFISQGQETSTDEIIGWLSEFHQLDITHLAPVIYQHQDDAMVRHMLSVACGLDSMVLGEPQILGQIKDAYRIAHERGTTGSLLERLFQHTFSVAKQVRTDTAIGGSPVSMAFAAVSLSRQIFGSLEDQTGFMIGAGETIELAARHLAENGLSHLIVANRSLNRAHELAAQFRGYAISLDEIDDHLAEADVLIASTASPDIILKRDQVERAIRKRKHRPMFMVDLAVPRDIDPAIGEMDDVYLYSVDDLAQVVQEGMESRREAAEQARQIIETEATHFMAWMRSLDGVDTIRQMRGQAQAARDETLEKAMRQLRAGESPEQVLEYLANTLTNRLLHQPTAQLNQAARTERQDLVRAAREIFSLKDDL